MCRSAARGRGGGRRRRRRRPHHGRLSVGNPHCVVFVDDPARSGSRAVSGPRSSGIRSSRVGPTSSSPGSRDPTASGCASGSAGPARRWPRAAARAPSRRPAFASARTGRAVTVVMDGGGLAIEVGERWGLRMTGPATLGLSRRRSPRPSSPTLGLRRQRRLFVVISSCENDRRSLPMSFVTRLRPELIAIAPPWRGFRGHRRRFGRAARQRRRGLRGDEADAVRARRRARAEASTAVLDIGVGVPHARLAGLAADRGRARPLARGLYEPVPTVAVPHRRARPVAARRDRRPPADARRHRHAAALRARCASALLARPSAPRRSMRSTVTPARPRVRSGEVHCRRALRSLRCHREPDQSGSEARRRAAGAATLAQAAVRTIQRHARAPAASARTSSRRPHQSRRGRPRRSGRGEPRRGASRDTAGRSRTDGARTASRLRPEPRRPAWRGNPGRCSRTGRSRRCGGSRCCARSAPRAKRVDEVLRALRDRRTPTCLVPGLALAAGERSASISTRRTPGAGVSRRGRAADVERALRPARRIEPGRRHPPAQPQPIRRALGGARVPRPPPSRSAGTWSGGGSPRRPTADGPRCPARIRARGRASASCRARGPATPCPSADRPPRWRAAGWRCVLHAHLPFVRHPEHPEFARGALAVRSHHRDLSAPARHARAARARRRAGAAHAVAQPDARSPCWATRCCASAIAGISTRWSRSRAARAAHRGRARLAPVCRAVPRDASTRDPGPLPRSLATRISSAALRGFAERGRIELATTAATHAVLPLLASVPATFAPRSPSGIAEHRRYFGRPTAGFWLPECAYDRGLDGVLADAGVRYFCVDTHAIELASSPPVHGVYAPLFCPSGVAAFGRDAECAAPGLELESKGIPAIRLPRVLSRHRLRPARASTCGRSCRRAASARTPASSTTASPARAITRSRTIPPGRAPRPSCTRRTSSRAGARQIDAPARRGWTGRPSSVCPFDAELFGHWWYEGPIWLDYLCRHVAAPGRCSLTTLDEYLDAHPTHQVAEPDSQLVGLQGLPRGLALERERLDLRPPARTPPTAWSRCARRHPEARGTTKRALDQAARELLLAQASDWAFIIARGTVVDYAVRRTTEHLRASGGSPTASSRARSTPRCSRRSRTARRSFLRSTSTRSSDDHPLVSSLDRSRRFRSGSMSTALVALVLLPMALTLVVGLSLLIAQPLLRPALSSIERARLRRAVARVARGDAALRGRQVEAALREYEAGFCLMIVRADPKVADEVNRHHVGLLSRLLAVADGSPAAARPAPRPGQGRPPARPPRGDAARASPAAQPLAARRAPHPARARAAPQHPADAGGGARADRRHPGPHRAQGRVPVGRADRDVASADAFLAKTAPLCYTFASGEAGAVGPAAPRRPDRTPLRGRTQHGGGLMVGVVVRGGPSAPLAPLGCRTDVGLAPFAARYRLPTSRTRPCATRDLPGCDGTGGRAVSRAPGPARAPGGAAASCVGASAAVHESGHAGRGSGRGPHPRRRPAPGARPSRQRAAPTSDCSACRRSIGAATPACSSSIAAVGPGGRPGDGHHRAAAAGVDRRPGGPSGQPGATPRDPRRPRRGERRCAIGALAARAPRRGPRSPRRAPERAAPLLARARTVEAYYGAQMELCTDSPASRPVRSGLAGRRRQRRACRPPRWRRASRRMPARRSTPCSATAPSSGAAP